MRNIVAAFLLGLALAGCVTAEQQRAENARLAQELTAKIKAEAAQECRDFGSLPGSPLYRQCRIPSARTGANQRAADADEAVGIPP